METLNSLLRQGLLTVEEHMALRAAVMIASDVLELESFHPFGVKPFTRRYGTIASEWIMDAGKAFQEA